MKSTSEGDSVTLAGNPAAPAISSRVTSSSKEASTSRRWLRVADLPASSNRAVNWVGSALKSSIPLEIWSMTASWSLSLRAWANRASSASCWPTVCSRNSTNSVFLAGMTKRPSPLSFFLAASHQRLNSFSPESTSGMSRAAICVGVAFWPSECSRIRRTTAAGSSATIFLTPGRSAALRARRCSAGTGRRLSPAYWSCIGWLFLGPKSMRIWLASRFHAVTRPKPQLLCWV